MNKELYTDISRNTIAIGTIFGNLKVIGYAGYELKPNPNFNFPPYYYAEKIHYWTTECLLCGNISNIRENNLLSGNSKSCGCNKYSGLKEYTDKIKSGEIKRNGKDNGSFKHGGSSEKLYITYRSMRDRCYNPNNKSYKDYGDRNINVCDEWLGENGYENFRKWSYENGYDPNNHEQLSIDRINVNKSYSPDNCSWAGRDNRNWHKQQGNNTTVNHIVNWGGVNYTITELAQHFGRTPEHVFYRIGKGGKTLEEAVLAPVWKTGKAGSDQRQKYIDTYGEFVRKPNSINPFVSVKYPEIDTNDPKLWYYSEDELAEIRGLKPVPQETEEEYQKSREAAKKALIEMFKNQKTKEDK